MGEVNRRDAIRTAGLGLGSLWLSGILADASAADAGPSVADPLAPRAPHFPAKAKRVIMLYMTGGVSHVDSFDPKPRLFADHGKTITIDEWQGRRGKYTRYLKRPDWSFAKHGESGIEVSSLFPEMAGCVDDLCVIRSMKSDHTNHYEATLQAHTGSITFARPSVGAWVSYGLGTYNRNLPSFVVIAPHSPYAGEQAWGSDFLPGCHQGTRVTPGPEPIADLHRRLRSAGLQEREIARIQEMNRAHAEARGGDPGLSARIRSFETAFGMQHEAPDAFDLASETDATLKLYGLERGSTQGFAWQCLVARRLCERGVRFIELIDSGASNNWDAHGDMQTHAPLARNVDRSVAGLIRDLKSRGLLEDTLVVWTTEFGRTPYHESADAKGREHHHWAFSTWLAGGGVKAGHVHGATDDHGIYVAEDAVHVHDLHATVLHLLGLDHTRLTFRHAGRDFRLTDVKGNVVEGLIA